MNKIKIFIPLILLNFTLFSCQKRKEEKLLTQTNFEIRKSEKTEFADLLQGTSYLPVYSNIYHINKEKSFELAITISIRNSSLTDSVYVTKADYYNTAGDKIREYLEYPIFLKPMETVEIIIEEQDSEGGSGANFVFDWAVKEQHNSPFFQAVMVSTYGQQGLAFTTNGFQIIK